jgi:hypothetical protein
MRSDMARACMTHCNAAADCGAIFIQVILSYLSQKYITVLVMAIKCLFQKGFIN